MANKKAEILTMNGQVVSPITLATNVLLDDGRTAQDLLDSRDESMFSPTITTSSSISKVGQGDNVDFSDNVIDGAYGSCVLKGKTLVNYNAEGNDRNEYVCMPSIEGNNLTVNGTVEGKVKSAILKGSTKYRDIDTGEVLDAFEDGRNLELVSVKMPVLKTYNTNNIFNPNNVEERGIYDYLSLDYFPVELGTKLSTTSKSGTVYWSSLFLYNKDKTLIQEKFKDSNVSEKTFIIDNEKVKYVRFKVPKVRAMEVILNYGDIIPYEPYEPFKSNILTVNEDVTLRSNGSVYDELDLLTGKLTQRIDEDGSVLTQEVIKTVDLSILDQDGATVEKLNTFKDITHYTCSSAEGSLIPTLSIEEGVKYQAIIKPSTKYSIVFNRTVASDSLTVDLGGATANVSSTTTGKTIVQNTTLPTLSHNYVKFLGVGNVIKDVQVIEGDIADDVEYFEGMIDVENPVVTNCNMIDVDSVDYKSNTISTNEVVLRSLPNGVCDTLDLMTGEYVQRVGEIVLNGSESWSVSGHSNWTSCYTRTYVLSHLVNKGTQLMADKMMSFKYYEYLGTNDVIGVSVTSEGYVCIKYLPNGTKPTPTEVAEYLKNNPIKIQYPFETTTIKIVDLKQHPFAYKDGYVVLTSSSEEVSLTPTIEYSLIANRLGQIQSNQKLVEKQQTQIDELESMVIANLVNTQYQQALNEIKLGVK